MAELVSSPGKSGGRQSSRLPVRVDLTALVDLAFLLITFFMLTTTLAKPKALPLVMPVPGPNEPVAASSTMTICLGKNNHAVCYVGTIEKPITAPKLIGYGSDLGNSIQTARQIAASTHKNMFVIIKPSDHSIYKSLVATLDAMNVNGVSSYAIAQIAPKDIDLLKQKGIY